MINLDDEVFEYIYVLKDDTKVVQVVPVPEDLDNWIKLDFDPEYNYRGKMYDVDTGTFIDSIAAAEKQRAIFKRKREQAVANLTVEYEGMVFDADETSQDRMSRAIVALDPEETILWVLADNTAANPTREQLKQVLRLAGEAQSNLWIET